MALAKDSETDPAASIKKKSDLKPYQSAILILFSVCHWKVNHSFQFHCCHFMLSSQDSSACVLTSLVEKWVQMALRLVSRGWYYSSTHFSRLFLSPSYIRNSLSASYKRCLSAEQSYWKHQKYLLSQVRTRLFLQQILLLFFTEINKTIIMLTVRETTSGSISVCFRKCSSLAIFLLVPNFCFRHNSLN